MGKKIIVDAERVAAARLERFERAFDDIDARFESLRELGLEWRAEDGGLSVNARRAVREMFARGEHRRRKQLAVVDASTRRVRKLGGKSAQRALRRWIVEHFDAPYPDLAEKRRLAREVGLSVESVSNCFINLRTRFWKRLVLALAAEIERDARRDARAT